MLEAARERLHREPGRVGIGEIGQHQHGRRMLEEAVRHLLHGEADVLEADLLADDVERRVRKAVVHRAHHAQQHGAVADAGVEQPQRRRARMDVGEFEPDPAGDHPLFAAGVDEQQIFLPVVEEAEVALRIGARPAARPVARRGRRRPADAPRALDDRGTRGARGRPVAVHEGADAVERLGGDAAAVAQPAGSLPSLTARRPKVDSASPVCRQ